MEKTKMIEYFHRSFFLEPVLRIAVDIGVPGMAGLPIYTTVVLPNG